MMVLLFLLCQTSKPFGVPSLKTRHLGEPTTDGVKEADHDEDPLRHSLGMYTLLQIDMEPQNRPF